MAIDLDDQLLSVLICPIDQHAPLTVGRPDDPDAESLTCGECGRSFPVIDGIPVLLPDREVAEVVAEQADPERPSTRAPAVDERGPSDGDSERPWT